MAFLGPSLRRRKVSERPLIRVAAAVVLSLLANAVAIALLVRAGAFDAPHGPARPQAVALAPLTADQWNANRAIAGAAPRAVPPPAARPELPAIPPPPPPRENEPKGQIVDVAPSQDSRKPKDSKYLSDRDNTVDKETRSRFAGTKLWENTLPSPSAGAKAKQGVPAPGEAGTADAAKPGKEAPKQGGTGAEKLAVPDQRQQERLALSTRPEESGPGDVAVPPKAERERVPGGARELELPGKPGEADGGGERKAGRLDPRLLPDAQSLARIAGGPSLDKLDGVEEADATHLNTRFDKFATFINRVMNGISHEWDPNKAYEARDPQLKMYPNHDRTTYVLIELDASGNLVEVKVIKRSGLDFLDDELLRAIRAAAPFPNPPTGLIENGTVHLPAGFSLLAARPQHLQVEVPAARLRDLPPESPLRRAYPE